MPARMIRLALIVALTALSAACASVGRGGSGAPVVNDPAPIVSGTMRPYQVRGHWYRPAEDTDYDVVGMASWYGDQFNGRPTSTGERFDMHALTAAHKTLPLPGLVEVTNTANGRRVIVRINDRGPFVDDRIIDLSRGAAEELGLLQRGVGQVRVRYLGRAPRLGGGRPLQQASADAAPASPPAVANGRGYWVQAGAFSDRGAAGQVASRLGDRASIDDASVDGRRYFRVLVGPWGDPNSAEQARLAVVARGYADALLISSR